MTINIKGHSVKFGVGLYFLGKAQKENDTDLGGLLQSIAKNPVADMVDLMYYSAKCEAELDDINIPISKRDFLEFLEENDDFKNTDGHLAKWSNDLVKSVKVMFAENDKEEAVADGVKKN